ncbi:hypothetical protein [Marinomonas balearica]|uniref:Uncharacterized protein n=1 Tax=Marinomonas balearica TaxID=491947 RepID=A0A4R6M9Z9_9GAMM|nr:hypothetical protein [Marinomonas balearica]TDO98056.1 hypothetical protein DFP79_1688 [Marinomonas balearica]
MQTFTVLQREHLTRAEITKEDIERLKLCGYVEKASVSANTPDEAVENFLAQNISEETKPVKSKRLKFMLWLGGTIAAMWFSYLVFVLLPMAF